MYSRMNPFTGLLELAGLETVFATVPPSLADVSYSIPTLWIDTDHDTAWLLMRVSGGLPTWALLATSHDPYSLFTEAGGDLVTEAGESIILN